MIDDINSITSNVEQRHYQNKTCLVTGGAGFVGSWLCEALLALGSKVICLDNFSSGQKKNISNLLNNPNFDLIEHDVSEPFSLNQKTDYIFHLASRAGPFEFFNYPIEIIKSNTIGTMNILEIAARDKAKVLFTSTSETYGDPDIFPTPETDRGNVNTIGPRGCYDESKRCGEALCIAYMNEKGVDVRIARIFNTYGPRIRADGIYGRVIPRFLDQAIKNEPITIFGDGSQTRCFCYVTDTVTGLLRLAAYDGCKGEVVNIGGTNEMTIIDLAKLIQKITKSDAKFIFSPLPKDDPKRRLPNTSKALKYLNWKPQINVDEGINKILIEL